jgi:hypothetical protein
MLPTPPFRIFVIFFFLFCSGREEEEEEEDDDVCVCVYPISSVFYEGLRSSSSRPLSPSSTRYSFPRRSVPDNDDSFILFSFLFLMCTNRRKKEAREREVVLFFFPSFYSLVYVHKICSSFLLDAGGRVGIL